jgi:hypothetical protein
MSKNNIKSKNSFSEKEFLLVFSQCWYKGIIMATKALSIKREIPMHPPHQKNPDRRIQWRIVVVECGK